MGRVKLATEPSRTECSHRLLSDASPSCQHAERGVNPHGSTVNSWRSLSIPEPRPVGQSVRVLFLFERDDDLSPGLEVFQLDHTVGISGLQNLRG